jgi:hypothetical protein
VHQRPLGSQPGTQRPNHGLGKSETTLSGGIMGKGILMWLVGIPIPIIILLLLFWR